MKLTSRDLKILTRRARRAPLGRARYCLHKRAADRLQEMVTAFRGSTYVRPHRQRGRQKSYHLIRGDLWLLFFDRRGRISKKIRLSASHPRRPFLVRFKADAWHTAYPVSRFVILHECLLGPYKKTEFAPWSPANGDAAAIRRFLKRIRA